MSADPGVWSGSPTSYGFQWRLCPSASDASGCVPIGGAGAQSYAPVPGDIQRKLAEEYKKMEVH